MSLPLSPFHDDDDDVETRIGICVEDEIEILSSRCVTNRLRFYCFRSFHLAMHTHQARAVTSCTFPAENFYNLFWPKKKFEFILISIQSPHDFIFSFSVLWEGKSSSSSLIWLWTDNVNLYFNCDAKRRSDDPEIVFCYIRATVSQSIDGLNNMEIDWSRQCLAAPDDDSDYQAKRSAVDFD